MNAQSGTPGQRGIAVPAGHPSPGPSHPQPQVTPSPRTPPAPGHPRPCHPQPRHRISAAVPVSVSESDVRFFPTAARPQQVSPQGQDPRIVWFTLCLCT